MISEASFAWLALPTSAAKSIFQWGLFNFNFLGSCTGGAFWCLAGKITPVYELGVYPERRG